MINQLPLKNPQEELFKLDLTLRFVRMFLDEPHGEDFKVRFRIEDENKQNIKQSQSQFEKGRQVLQLDTLAPFNLHIIGNSDKSSICPFQLFFTSFQKGTIKRRMPVNQGVILKHYFQCEENLGNEPLEQIYSFQGGEIIYRVWLRVQKLEEGMRNEIADGKMKGSSILRSSMRSSRGEESAFKQTSTGLKTDIKRSRMECEQPSAHTPSLPTQMSEDEEEEEEVLMMSIDEMAEQLEAQRQQNRLNQTENMPLPKKLKRLRSMKQEKKEGGSKSSQIRMKLIVVLLALGVVALLSQFFLGKTGKHQRARQINNPRSAGSYDEESFEEQM